MCGRYTLHHPEDEIAERFEVAEMSCAVAPRYNIAPSRIVAIVVQDD